MAELVKIEDTELAIREYNGQRVVTFKDIDTVHKRPNGTAKNAFRRNKKHFIDGIDYFVLSSRENSKVHETYLSNISIPTRGITVLTESGYLMIVKAFTDDLSWQVQRQLVNVYFSKRQNNVKKQITSKSPYRTSDTPIPRNPSFYERNKWRMHKLCKARNVSISFLYHNILIRVGEEFDLSAAEEIYEVENGYKPQYPMDMIDYFSDLSSLAEIYLDNLEKYI
jgi:hypothetical protein